MERSTSMNPRISYDGVHVLEIPSDTDPIQAVEDAAILLEYAGMHSGMFSRKKLEKLKLVRAILRQVAEDID